jgi:hypothetical protein
MTPIQWLICAATAIGFAFDVYELSSLASIVRPALDEKGAELTSGPSGLK